MRAFLSALPLALVVALAANCAYADDDDNKKYDDNGVTFTYPKDWNVKVDPKPGVTSITIENKKGSLALVQVYSADTDPKLVMSELDKSLKKSFAGKIVKDSDKASKRKLIGEEREGQKMSIMIVGDITSDLEYYAFKGASKKTVCVTLQSTSADAGAKKLVDAIADSLMEKEKK